MTFQQKPISAIAKRFRGYLPVVIDVETGGLDPSSDALLEIAVVILKMDPNGKIQLGETLAEHVMPYEGGGLNPEALKINQIDPTHPFRFAITEAEALEKIFYRIKQELLATHCQRAVLVGHNAWFDLAFVKAAAERCEFKKIPLHKFTSFDTATLAGLAFGQTVLARAVRAAGIHFNPNEAHSAIYDAEKTAALFCHIVNCWGDAFGRITKPSQSPQQY